MKIFHLKFHTNLHPVLKRLKIFSVPIHYSFPSRYAMSYKNELEHFVNLVQEGQRYCFDGNDTLAVSKIANACEESVKTGLPVRLEWTDEEIPDGYLVSQI